ncbi:MAG TPA: carboxypeptidase regulatory-like domain-containing protein [Candidatus Sulfotelmatobacter sp.]
MRLTIRIAAILLALSGVIVSAQVSKGSISGTVIDPSGAALPGAEIKATALDTNQSVTTTSGSTGAFKVSLLPVGTYTMEVSKSGFHKASMSSVSVTPGVDTGLGGIKLEIGSTSETVEVSASTPLVETTQAQITNTFESAYLDNIPGIQENQGLDVLAVLLPGVSSTRDVGFSNTNGMGFSVDGLRGRSNDQQIDGQNNNDNSVAGPGIFIGDAEFVNQYQVTTNNFGAEYGRNAGSVVNIITKSGGNKFHGSVYGTESNSVLTTLTNQQANTVWGEGLTKPPRFNDEFTGATIGGPWVKDKVFFFGGFDDEIISSKAVDGNGALTPDATGLGQLAACYPGSASVAALQAYGPYSIGGNPTPLGTPQVKNYPSNGYAGFVPNDGGTGCNVELNGVQRTLGNGSHEYSWVFRNDIQTSRETVSARYIFQKQVFFNVDEGQAAQGYPVNVPSLAQSLGLSWTHKITNQMLNELRLNVGRQNVQFGGNTLGTVPLQGALESGLANVAFQSGSLLGFGPATNFPQGRIVNTYQIQDNWSYVHGKHQWKAGANFTYQRSPNKFLPNANGAFSFADWGTFAADDPALTSVTLGNPDLDFREYDSFYYLGDDWKATNHLTLNLGLTYSYYGQPANLFHNNDTKQQTGGSPFWSPNLPASVTTFPSIPAPKNSWGPSVGFAYTPDWGGWLFGREKTVIRGGYRLSYDPPFYNIYLNIASSAPQVLAQTIVPGQPLTANPFGPAVRSELASFLTLGVSDPRSFSETAVTPNFGPDRVHSWSFGIQRELGGHAATEVRYVGNHGQNLFQSINGNPYLGCGDAGCTNPITGGAEAPGLVDGVAAGVFSSGLLPAGLTPCPAASAVVPSAVGRENCNEGVLRNRTNTAYSDYNGLQAEFRTTNLFNQLTMKTNYTWSKTTDNASEIFGTFEGGGTYAFAQDPLNFKGAEHGLSALDFPQTWTVSFNEAIPVFTRQHGILGHMFGGWSVAATYILQSGQTVTPEQIFLSSSTSPYNTLDNSFNAAFNSGFETARPFVGNPSAPGTAIGIYAVDACNTYGNPLSCAAAPNSLVDFTQLNASNGATTTAVQASQVRFIANTNEAQILNGTPYGNAARNILRDAKTNVANFEVAKTVDWGERARIIWHMSMVNALNHPNYTTTDPFLEDAGLVQEGTGFDNPTVQNGGNRVIRFGMKVTF